MYSAQTQLGVVAGTGDCKCWKLARGAEQLGSSEQAALVEGNSQCFGLRHFIYTEYGVGE